MKKKHYIIIAIILVIAIAVYFYWKKKKVVVDPGTEVKSLDKTFNIQVADNRNDNFPLYTNSKGPRVETLQRAVNRQIEKQNLAFNITPPDAVLVPDGIFGEKTKAAIIKVFGVSKISDKGVTETQFNNIIELSNK